MKLEDKERLVEIDVSLFGLKSSKVVPLEMSIRHTSAASCRKKKNYG